MDCFSFFFLFVSNGKPCFFLSFTADDEEDTTKCDRALGGDETPESSSGNRDEGYSTMSSDVQGTAEPPSAKGLEDVKEANENESNALTESSPCSRYTMCREGNVGEGVLPDNIFPL